MKPPPIRMCRSCQTLLPLSLRFPATPATQPSPPHRPRPLSHLALLAKTYKTKIEKHRRPDPPPHSQAVNVSRGHSADKSVTPKQPIVVGKRHPIIRPSKARALVSIISPAEILSEITIPTYPTTLSGNLDNPEYDMYNFRDIFVQVSENVENNTGKVEPIYQKRTFVADPTKTTFVPLIPPRSVIPYQRVYESEIAHPDPDMGHPMRNLDELDPDVRRVRNAFRNHIWRITTKDKDLRKHDLDTLMDAYLALPSPRVCYLTRVQVRRLILNIARIHNYQWFVYEHYATVIHDMQVNGTVIRLSEWAGLIDALSKGYYYDRQTRAQRASEVLSEMIQAGIKPTIITYISLLQAAVRAKDWNMVQVLDKEIRERGFDDHILVWTERFRIAGLLGDIRQIHDLFREFSAKSIAVDIVFMNTVLAAFLGADCPQVAELVYHRLRKHSLGKFGHTPLPRRPSRITTRAHRRIFLTGIQLDALERTIEHELHIRRIREDQLYEKDGTPTDLHSAFSQWVENHLTPYTARLIPNRETLRVFISYHCHYTGRMEDVAYYLNECHLFRVLPNYGIYTDLLHGFFVWHNPSDGDNQWNEARLRGVFDSVRMGIENKQVRVVYAFCLAAIRAFGKVLGGKAAREVWRYLSPLMEINENVMSREGEAAGWLEELVRSFEAGEKLGPGMSGRDWKYRVGDWRMSYS